MLPIILRKPMKLIEDNCREVEVIDFVNVIEYNNMFYRVLVSKVVNRMMFKHQDINDGSYTFAKCMAMFVDNIVRDMFSIETTTKTTFNSKGELVVTTHETISTTTPEPEFNKMLFREFDEPQTTVTIKGSNLIMDNNSEEYLNLLASEKFRVKEIDPELVRLYALMKYDENKNNVSESKSEYFDRMMKLAEETILYLGHEYSNTRKLDASCRDYSLNRFGFATEYGDSFEKNLIEPAQEYQVTSEGIQMAKDYLCDEFGVKSWRKLFEKANKAIEENLKIAVAYRAGRNVEFTIDSKTFGKYLHIQEVVNTIIYNVDGYTSCLLSYDLTNSGAQMMANQFGDEKYCTVANLMGGDRYDTHQLVADYLGLSRDEAKPKMQGPNHGGRVPAELQDMVDDIFGESYKYIRKTAEYGIELAKAGVTSVELTAPDGLISYWNPYSKGSKVQLENGRYVEMTTPFVMGLDGSPKVSGLAVKGAHQFDSIAIRKTKRYFIERGIGIKTTLDNIYCPAIPGIKEKLIELMFESFDETRGCFENQLKLIELQTGISRGWNLPERPGIVRSSNIF